MILAAVNSPLFAAGIKVAVVKSWMDGSSVFDELTNNWAAYGSIPLTIDYNSLRNCSSFTYDDLRNTGADVLWLSNPAGGLRQYSDAEVEAIQQYVNQGHSILGTYKVFQTDNLPSIIDNRKLAPIFGLRQDISYNLSIVDGSRTFDILSPGHLLFEDIDNPYDSNGFPDSQVPADDYSWDTGDFGLATLLAQTDDNRGVITWYQTDSYHAVFISQMPEFTGTYGGKYYGGNPADMQFLYNALTVPEPAATILLTLGGIAILRRKTHN